MTNAVTSTVTLKTIKDGEEWHEMLDERPVAEIILAKVNGERTEPFVSLCHVPIDRISGTRVFKNYDKTKSVNMRYLSEIDGATIWSEIREALHAAIRSHIPTRTIRRDGQEPYSFTGSLLAKSTRAQSDGTYKNLSVYRTIGGTLIAHYSDESRFEVIKGQAFIVETAEELTKIVGYEDQAQEVMMKAGLYAGELID